MFGVCIYIERKNMKSRTSGGNFPNTKHVITSAKIKKKYKKKGKEVEWEIKRLVWRLQWLTSYFFYTTLYTLWLREEVAFCVLTLLVVQFIFNLILYPCPHPGIRITRNSINGACAGHHYTTRRLLWESCFYGGNHVIHSNVCTKAWNRMNNNKINIK